MVSVRSTISHVLESNIKSALSYLMSMDPESDTQRDECQSLCWKCFRKLHISSWDNDDGEMTPFQHPRLHFKPPPTQPSASSLRHQAQLDAAGSRILTFANWVIAEADKTMEQHLQ